MILSCYNVSFSVGTETILDSISFQIEDHEKAAVVGVNGAGKSTLLKIITGEIVPDCGEITIGRDKTVGYLAQHQDIDSQESIYDTMMSVRKDLTQMYDRIREIELEMKNASGEELESLLAQYDRLNHRFEQENGYALRSEAVGVLKGLGFEESEFGKRVSDLSGGQRTRISLGRLLLMKPDIIMLDEPTNHLDMNSVAWLENYLSSYTGAVIIVAHDRYFLDRIASKVIEIENHRSTVYKGTYTDYSQKKAQLRDAQLKAWINQQRDIRHQEDVIRKLKQFNREKSIKRAQSREKMLDRVEKLEQPAELNANMSLKLTATVQSGNDVLYAEGLSKSFGPERLFEDINIDIKRGERVAIIGDNGTGKSTILKIITGSVLPDAGYVRTGSNVTIGYYDQEQQMLDMDKTIFDEISDRWPDMTQTRIRNVLASFLFTNDDVYKYIRDLSGGEKARVSLAKLMLSDANLLILDEPTNHLDIVSKEILESALSSYTGTLLYVSHDRYFINKTATRILELSEKGLLGYSGNYDYYLEKRQNPSPTGSSGTAVSQDDQEDAQSRGRLDYRQQKEEQALKRKRENQLKKTIARIDEIDVRQGELDELLTHEEIYTDPARLLELSQEKEALDKEQTELMEIWENLENAGE